MRIIKLLFGVIIVGVIYRDFRFSYAAGFGAGAGKIPFWLEVHANQQIDSQVTTLLADKAAFAVLRFRNPAPVPFYDWVQIVERLQEEIRRPVLIYGWITRYREKSDTSSEMMGWLLAQPELHLAEIRERGGRVFGDVRNPVYRAHAIAGVIKVLDRYRADGVAIDLAVRTPITVPIPIAKLCAAKEGFCKEYAKGIDMLFKDLKKELGPERQILYNGLWNLRDGMVQDQAGLLESADAVIVEYFGGRPNKGTGTFVKDIAPYIELITSESFPTDKKLFVYGRGLWRYENYQDDYFRQRYLFGSYLLAARSNTAFKYHSSFQLPAHAGRSGGLDLYADWFTPLGDPVEKYQKSATLLTRRFSQGLVLVAPDNLVGGQYTLDQPMYTIEGEILRGVISINPGQAQILLDKQPTKLKKPVSLALRSLAGWTSTRWISTTSNGSYMAISTVESPELEGDHDLLLDAIRTLSPPTKLKLHLRSKNNTSRLLLVAEIDDAEKEYSYAVVCVLSQQIRNCPKEVEAPLFRRPSTHAGVKWPSITSPVLLPGEWQDLNFVGNRLFDDSRYRFRRWAYARIDGSMDISAVSLQSDESP